MAPSHTVADAPTQILTSEERETLNAAIAIILSRTPLKASWQLSAQNYYGTPSADVTYFDTNNEQHSAHTGKRISGETFADRVERAFAIQAEADADKEGYRARRAEHLRAELAKLEAAA